MGHMKKLLIGSALLALIASGCTQGSSSATNQKQPGPAVGRAVGVTTGAVIGNVAAGTVAATEGAGQAIGSAFIPEEKNVIRKWETVTTQDGRSIKVSREYYIDEDGNIIGEVK